MKILLVEDDTLYRTALQKQLVNLGHTVVEATNGIEALEIIDNNKNFDAIICDIIMPQLSGPSFILSLKRRYTIDLPQIIIISTINDGEAFVNKLGITYNYFLSKPIKPVHLELVLSNIKITAKNEK